MTDLHKLVLQALGIRLLRDKLDARDAEIRAEISTVLGVGDRKAAQIPGRFQGLDGEREDIIVGAAQYRKGYPKAHVTDPAALLAWVRANRPDEIVEDIRPAYRTALLDAAKKAGAAVSKEGEVIPGIEVTRGAPYLAVTPVHSDEVEDAMVDALFHDKAQIIRALIESGE